MTNYELHGISKCPGVSSESLFGFSKCQYSIGFKSLNFLLKDLCTFVDSFDKSSCEGTSCASEILTKLGTLEVF